MSPSTDQQLPQIKDFNPSHPMFQKGKAVYERFLEDEDQEYKKFRRLD